MGIYRAGAGWKCENSLNSTPNNHERHTKKAGHTITTQGKRSGVVFCLPGATGSAHPREIGFQRLTEGVAVHAEAAVDEERVGRYGRHGEHGAPRRRAGPGDVTEEGTRRQETIESETRGGVELGRVTFESRSRCPGPSRTYPALGLPADGNLWHYNTTSTQTGSKQPPLERASG